MDIYGYIFLGQIYIYIYPRKKLYVQQLGFIRVSLLFTGAGVCWWGGTKQSSDLNQSNNSIFLDEKCHVCHQKDAILIMPLSVHTAQSLCTWLGHFSGHAHVPCPIQGDTRDTGHVAFLKSLMLGQIPKLTLLLCSFGNYNSSLWVIKQHSEVGFTTFPLPLS